MGALRNSFRAFAFTAIGVSCAPGALADDAPSSVRLPVAQAQRPLTLPRLVLDPTLRFVDIHQAARGSFADLDGSAAIGITDDLTVGALVLPLQLAAPAGEGARYGQTVGNRGPSVDARYRFVHGPVELAAGLALRVFTVSGLHGGAVLPTVALRGHASNAVRIDLAVTVNVTRATVTPGVNPVLDGEMPGVAATSGNVPANAVRVDAPVSVLYNVAEPVHIGASSGLTIYDVDNAKTSTGVPLGVFMGFAVAGTDGPVVDVDPFLTFPYFIMPWRRQVTNTAQYQVGLTVTGHFYL